MQFFRGPIGSVLTVALVLSQIAPVASLHAEPAALPNSTSYWAGQFASLPNHLAVLKEVHDSQSEPVAFDSLERTDRTLLLMEDTPDNFSVQENLSEILKLLAIQSGVNLVFVEGAEGDVSIPFAQPARVSAKRTRAIRSWMRNFKISGPESAHLSSSQPIALVGADNAALYDRAVQTYLYLEVMRDRAKRHLKSLSLMVALLNQAHESGDARTLETIQNTLAELSSLVRFLEREPGTSTPEEIREMLGKYRTASSSANRLVRQIGLGDTGLFFNDPVFQKIAQLERKLSELARLRDLEIVRRMLEKMDEYQVSAAVLVIRPARLRETTAQLQAAGASFLRIQPASSGPDNPAAYAAEVRRQFESIPTLRHALKENQWVYLNRSGNPLRALPLMARAPFELARQERPAVAYLAAEIGGEAAAQTEAMAEALSHAIQVSTLRAMPLPSIRQMPGPGNAQGEIETLDLAGMTAANPAAALPSVSVTVPEPVSLEADNQERYRAFTSHLKSLGVPLPANLKKQEKIVDSGTLQSRFIEYAVSLSRLWDGGKNRLTQEAAVLAKGMSAVSAAFSAKSVSSLWKELSDGPRARGKFLSLAGRWGWIHQSRLTLKDLSAAREDHAKLAKFMTNNVMPSGIPKSYQTLPGYWERVHTAVDSAEQIDEVLERLINENCLLIYDGAVWQIALALLDSERYASSIENLNRTLLRGRLGFLETIRAWKEPYKYGDDQVSIPEENAYFFRLISDRYVQQDQMTGLNRIANFPNNQILHHEDWKPITGEQAWAAILGPLHSAHLTGELDRPHSESLRLAESILPALEAMASPIGAIYHAPHGTHGKSGFDISNENNFSMLAALRILRLELLKKGKTYEASRVAGLITGILSYLKQYAFDPKEGVFLQGGFYLDNQFMPSQVFAVDCQTWAIAALGPEWIDQQFGEGTSYRIWQTTRRRSGYYDDWGRLQGIGFTDQDRVLSIEWTAGAVLACRMMARYYAESHPDWAKDAESDAIRMRLGLDQYRVTLPDGSEAYLYANRRFFIPFGWWANPLPSLVSTGWVILLDKHYNPFWPEGIYAPENETPSQNSDPSWVVS